MVTQESIIKKIGDLLNDLTDQHAFLQANPTEEEEVYLALFEANTAYLMGHVNILKKLTDLSRDSASEQEEVKKGQEVGQVPEPEEESIPEEQVEAEFAGDVHANNIAEVDHEAKEVPHEEEVVPVEDLGVLEGSSLPTTEEPVVEESLVQDVEEESVHEDEPMHKTVVEEAHAVSIPSPLENEEEAPAEPKKPLTLNELFSAQRKQEQEQKPVESPLASISSQQTISKPAVGGAVKRINDIKSAVSLNDKLLFIKDLFNGYSLAYTEAIELLSRYDNFADADAFLQNSYAKKNNWESKQATVDKLYAILKQRFG